MDTNNKRRNPFANAMAAWNQFWFAPTDPATLSAVRLLAGAVLFYTHLVWSFRLEAFFGPEGFLPTKMMQAANASRPFIWTWFTWIESPGLLWTVHIVALLIFFMLMIGLFSRIVAPLAFLTAVAYANRLTPGATFGLDYVNCFLALYLMLGPCGARYSVDRFLANRKEAGPVQLSASANLAIRLIQVHLCVLYLFAGLSKLQGITWWDGSAYWWRVANFEQQAFSQTWLANWPAIVAVVTYSTLFWEISYPFLIWNRKLRPWLLAFAFVLHGIIAFMLGMATFGLALLAGNLAFISPERIQRILGPRSPKKKKGSIEAA